jgi:hypothetical protein
LKDKNVLGKSSMPEKLIGEFDRNNDDKYLHIIKKDGRKKVYDEYEDNWETIIDFLAKAKKFEIKILEYEE